MTIDTEIRLSGDAAREFYDQMRSVDMNAIASRDAFLADVNCRLDEEGTLIIYDEESAEEHQAGMDRDFSGKIKQTRHQKNVK